MNILVTGAAGFIGSHFVRLLRSKRPDWNVTILDALTYSGNLSTVEPLLGDSIRFVHGRIEDPHLVRDIVQTQAITHIVNFAAESHNDRSFGTHSFLTTNAIGVENLLNIVREYRLARFLQVSTDEVYGSIDAGQFFETTPFQPNTPYSASKASGELVCRAHLKAYGSPIVITRGGNTYGPYQYPEKLISFFTVRLLLGKMVPLYGDGSQVREWIHARDHATGILAVLERGLDGEAYNIGDINERRNREILDVLLQETGRSEDLVKTIEDPRKGAHDARYSMSCDKVAGLGWAPEMKFEDSLRDTVRWYQENEDWWMPILENSDYQAFIQGFYGKSLGADL